MFRIVRKAYRYTPYLKYIVIESKDEKKVSILMISTCETNIVKNMFCNKRIVPNKVMIISR